MTVRDVRIVDWLGIEKGTGNILLTVVDDVDWEDENAHLYLLQEKLNVYLAFIEAGEVFDMLAMKLGQQVDLSRPIKVNIIARYEIPPQALAFFDFACNLFRSAGVELTHKFVGNSE